MTDLKDKLEAKASGEVVPAGRAPLTVAQVLEVQKREIAKALPTGMTADRFARVVLTEVKRTPKLRQCTAESLLGAVMLAAQLGLEPGPMQLSYLTPRRNHGTWEVQFQIGYRGMIDLATRSGRVLDVAAHCVYEDDEFEYEYGLNPVLRHKPARGERGEAIYAYAVARFPNGGSAFVVLDTDEIERRRERSGTPKDGPWVTDFAPMAAKTAVRALEPFMPRSVEFAQASRFDGAVVTDFTSADLVDHDDVLDVEEVDDADVGGPGAGDAAPSEATGEDPPPPAGEAEPAPGPDDVTAEAFRLVTERRAVKAAGAARNHRELDEFLNELGLDMDLATLDAERGPAVITWLAEHPVGAK